MGLASIVAVDSQGQGQLPTFDPGHQLPGVIDFIRLGRLVIDRVSVDYRNV